MLIKIGRFLGHYYRKGHKPNIVIGKDTRRSSYMIEYALVAGLIASGADAYLLHVTRHQVFICSSAVRGSIVV